MNKYLSLSFWFNSSPEILTTNQQHMLIGLAAVLIVIAIFLITGLGSHIIRISKKLLPTMLWLCFTNAIIALVFVFLNYEIIPYFRAYILYLIWALLGIVWIIYVIRQIQKNSAHRFEQSDREKEIKKYLPR